MIIVSEGISQWWRRDFQWNNGKKGFICCNSNHWECWYFL